MDSVPDSSDEDLVVDQWGNCLAVRLTQKIAQAAGFTAGQTVKVEVIEGCVLLRPIREPDLTLDRMLQRFDPTKHGGEVMASKPAGREIL